MDINDRVAAWLLGTAGMPRSEELSNAGIAGSAIGLLQRMFQAFPGDPVGPAENLAIGTTPTGLMPPGLACSALVSIEVQPVRLRVDGTEVSTSVGLLLPVGSIFNLTGHDTLVAARFCGTVAGAVIDVSYWT